MTILLLLVLWIGPQGCELEFNIPDEVRRFFKEKPNLARYQVSSRINPFYLRGDFDGDGSTDLAVLVIEQKTKRRGMVVFHPKKDSYFVVGAGRDFLRSDGYNYKDFDFKAWSVYTKDEVGQSLHEEDPPPRLLGEAILAEWPEAGSGIIFWNGEEYKWYQVGG